MSIKYAILGILSWKPSTGYEMKKIFEDSSIMYWSGNNNQIYKSLVQLLDEGLVTGEVRHQEASPSKKVYTITEDGLDELKKWVLSRPEAPEFRKTFLVRLAWADQLSSEELNRLLLNYENEIKLQILLQKEKSKRGRYTPNRSQREVFLWDKISENLISSLKGELNWVQGIRKELFEKETAGQRERMNYRVIEKEGSRYVEFISAQTPLGTEQDALELVALCGENNTNLLMLHHNALDEDFFKYKTGMAGAMLQKFSNYYVKTAVVMNAEIAGKAGRIGTALEANKGGGFKVFEKKESAEAWLLS